MGQRSECIISGNCTDDLIPAAGYRVNNTNMRPGLSSYWLPITMSLLGNKFVRLIIGFHSFCIWPAAASVFCAWRGQQLKPGA